MSTYKLRKFRGIADLERRILLPEGSPERHGLARDSDLVSLDLFGITRADTLYLGQPDLSSIENFNAEADWESHFDFLHAKHYETLHHMFGELDWNVSNGEYKYLQCTALFDRQIICAANGLKGHLPDDTKTARRKVNPALQFLFGLGKQRAQNIPTFPTPSPSARTNAGDSALHSAADHQVGPELSR